MEDEQWRKEMELVKLLHDLIPHFNGDRERFCAFKGSVMAAKTIVDNHPSYNKNTLFLNVVKSRITGPISLSLDISRQNSIGSILSVLEAECDP